uniref:RanBP2-type domain-containing protein n=1 Tax=Trypanosoma congolense (strain IL3000) TaxID=1068625 RepID=G0UWF9_TRYCI|nr:conserved hypothetical protein [Trypanosoma congolense IL3000]
MRRRYAPMCAMASHNVGNLFFKFHGVNCALDLSASHSGSYAAVLKMQAAPFSAPTAVALQSWAARANRMWMCVKKECRHVSPPTAANCESCGEPKPNLKGWLCVECNTRNHKGVRKCHKCSSSFECSSEYWMCIACEKNNRVDDLDDNSRCGFCGYDMAPMTMTESEALRIQQERSERLREEQEKFDELSAKDADEQFGDETAGADGLSPPVKQTLPPPPRGVVNIPEVKPFTPLPQETKHSRILRSRPSPSPSVPAGPPGFDWMCREPRCAVINAGDEENCTACGTHIEPKDWECCHCGAMNHMSRAKCFNCRVTISISWVCSDCRTATSIYERNCRKCEKPRPPTEPKEARDIQSQSLSGGRGVHPIGGRGRGPMRQDWNCVECQGHNFASRTSCFRCGAARSTADSALSGGIGNNGGGFDGATDHVMNHNNWFCRHCQSSNFRTRSNCWQCGRPSSESGATTWSEDDSVPHFEKEGFQETSDERVAEGQMNTWTKKTDDWTCGKCFSKNFKNRQECHKCGATKSVAVPQRRAFVRKPVKI